MNSSNRPQVSEAVPKLKNTIGFRLFNPESKSTPLDQVKTILQHAAKCDYNIQFIMEARGINPQNLEIDTLYLKKCQNGDVIYLFKTKENKLRKRYIEADYLYGDAKDLVPYVLDLIRFKYLQGESYDYNIQIVEDFPESISDDTLYLKDNDVEYKIEYSFINKGVLVHGSFEKAYLSNLMSPEEWLSKVLTHIKEEENYQPPLKAVAMARKDPALVLAKSTFKEEWCGGRRWKNCLSALQYAAWAGDTPMVDEFLETVTLNMKAVALHQLEEVRDCKLQRPHLSAIDLLISKYKTLSLDRYHGEDGWTSLTTKACWPAIRDLQFGSVVNLIQHFCSSTPFSPLPTFKEFPETRSLVAREQCPNSLTSSNMPKKMYETDDQLIHTQLIWTSHLVDLSSISSFGSGLSKGYAQKCTNAEVPLLNYVEVDYQALNEFYRLRKDELAAQIQMLKTSLENQPLSPSPR